MNTFSDELPEGWENTSLGEICQAPQYGWTASAVHGGKGIKLVRTTDISSGLIEWDSVPGCDRLPENPNKYLLKNGDILISRAGSVGLSHLITKCPPAIFASYLIRFRPHTPIQSDFVSYFLKTNQYWSAIADETLGIAVPNVNASKLKEIEFPLPPLAEQKRIVAKVEELLAQVNSAKERLLRVQKLLKRFRQSVLTAAVTGKLTEEWREKKKVFDQKDNKISSSDSELIKLYELPESWYWDNAGSVLLNIQYGSNESASEISNGSIPILRMGNIQDAKLDLRDLKYIPDRLSNINKFVLKKGDVLFNRTNSPELVGKAALFNVNIKAVFASYLIRLSCNTKLISPTWVCWWINSAWGREWARAVRTDGVSQSNINATKLKAMPIPIPLIDEQKEIIRRVESLFALSDKIEKQVALALARTEKLTQSILAKAFRGELVPTEAELARQEGRDYEPASVLLERIKREREKEIQKPKITTRRKRHG